jgi:hypothetical protein
MCQSSTLKASILVSSGMKNEPSFIALASLLRERIASLPPELGAMLVACALSTGFQQLRGAGALWLDH